MNRTTRLSIATRKHNQPHLGLRFTERFLWVFLQLVVGSERSSVAQGHIPAVSPSHRHIGVASGRDVDILDAIFLEHISPAAAAHVAAGKGSIVTASVPARVVIDWASWQAQVYEAALVTVINECEQYFRLLYFGQHTSRAWLFASRSNSDSVLRFALPQGLTQPRGFGGPTQLQVIRLQTNSQQPKSLHCGKYTVSLFIVLIIAAR